MAIRAAHHNNLLLWLGCHLTLAGLHLAALLVPNQFALSSRTCVCDLYDITCMELS